MTKFPLLTLVILFGLISSTISKAAPYDSAMIAVAPEYRHRVLSIYGTGGPYEVKQWEVKFLENDDKVRIVKVHDRQLDESYTRPGRPDNATRVFDPTSAPSLNTALRTARDYARSHQIPFNHVAVRLTRSEEGHAPSWRVELLQNDDSRGFVYTNAIDGSLARYESNRGHANHHDGDDDVESTFKGIGGDMEEFFTGHRSIDR